MQCIHSIKDKSKTNQRQIKDKDQTNQRQRLNKSKTKIKQIFSGLKCNPDIGHKKIKIKKIEILFLLKATSINSLI